MEQMLDTKGRRHVDSLKLGNSLANCPNVANVIFFGQLWYYQRCFPSAFIWCRAMLKCETQLISTNVCLLINDVLGFKTNSGSLKIYT